MTAFQPVSRRNGVIDSVMQRKRSVQTPVSWVRSSRGFALRLLVSAAQINQATGPKPARNTAGFRSHRINADCGMRNADLLSTESTINPQSAILNPQCQ